MIGILDFFLPSRSASVTTTGGRSSPFADFWYHAVGTATTSHINVTHDTALTYSAVWAATRLLAGTASWLPLNLHRYDGSERTIAYGDPRQRLVHDRPNKMMSSMMFRATGFAQQINRGNFYAEIVRDARTNMPVEMWPISPSQVRAVIDEETDKLWYQVRNSKGDTGYIPSEDMLHVPSIISDDGILGKGVIEHARETIGTGIAAERRAAADFGSGRLPKVVIETPGSMTPEQRDAFRRDWNTIHAGENGHQVALLQGGAAAKPLSHTAADAQFLEGRQFTIEEIARWYGVPPHMLQHLMQATFNNIEHLGIDFVTYSLMLWLKLWEQELWSKLLTPEEQETHSFRFNVNGLLRGDSAARREWYRTLVTLGVYSRNEVRELEDMNPVEGGDVHLIQGAMVAIGDDGIPMLAAHNEPAAEVVDDEPDDDTEDEAEGEPDDDGAAETAPAPTQAALLTVARAVLQDSLSRMAYKEAQAASRAANKPSEFGTWLTDFYGEHEAKLAEAVRVAVVSMKAAGIDATEAGIVSAWCGESKSVLDSCLDAPQATFATVVKNRVSDWSSVRVSKFVDDTFPVVPAQSL